MCKRMKDSGVERIGQIPMDWKIIKLGKTVDSKIRYPIGDGDHGSINPSMYLESGIPYIRVQNLSDSKEIKWDNMVYISEETQKNNSKSILRENDILIAKTGATVGKTCIIPDSIKEANTTSSVGKITVDKQNFDYRYVYYSLRADFTQDLIKLIASQKTAQPGFNIVDMIEFPICQPSKEIQESIANYLDKKVSQIDDIISKQKSLIEKYKAYKQSLITETVTKGLNKNVPMKDSGIEWIGEIPSHWEIKSMKYLCSCNDDSLTNSEDKNMCINYVDISSVTFESGIVNYEEMLFKNAPSRARRVTQYGDIIISTVRTYLKAIAIIPDDKRYVVSTGFAVIRAKYILNRYLDYFIKSEYFINLVSLYSKGISYPAIDSFDLMNIKILEPSIDEQEEIANFLDKKCNAINLSITKKEQLIEKLESYKKSLIYECVTGKREVN